MSDIVIIGGGIIGTSVGYHLRDTRHRVTILEKDGLGAGTTGKSIGCFAWHLNYAEIEHEIASRSWRLYERLITDGTIDYHENGFLKAAETPGFFEKLEEGVEQLRAAGIPATTLSDSEIAEHNVNPEVAPAGATFYPSVGRLDPGEIIAHFETTARHAGVRFETGTEVTAIDTADDQVTGVRTPDTTIEADIVVNAAGPWASRVNDMAGVSLPLKHTLAPITVLETNKNFELPTVILESGVYFSGERSAKTLAGYAPHESSDEDLWDAAVSLENPDEDQGIGIGSVSEEHRQVVAEYAAHAIPKLAEAKVSNEWLGIRCITPDHHPMVGPTSVAGFYAATGMSGEGITLGPACGELLAQLIDTGESNDELEFLSPRRFPESARA